MKLRLSEAVARYRKEKGSASNAYDWFRQAAQSQGEIPIGPASVRAWKVKGVWHVDAEDFSRAISLHRVERRKMSQVSRDLDRGIVHGKHGDTVVTEDGGYEIHGNFRLVWSEAERSRKESLGEWFCNRCNVPAHTKHEKEECHRCSDWGGCGRDCTLSEMSCPKCRQRIQI